MWSWYWVAATVSSSKPTLSRSSLNSIHRWRLTGRAARRLRPGLARRGGAASCPRGVPPPRRPPSAAVLPTPLAAAGPAAASRWRRPIAVGGRQACQRGARRVGGRCRRRSRRGTSLLLLPAPPPPPSSSPPSSSLWAPPSLSQLRKTPRRRQTRRRQTLVGSSAGAPVSPTPSDATPSQSPTRPNCSHNRYSGASSETGGVDADEHAREVTTGHPRGADFSPPPVKHPVEGHKDLHARGGADAAQNRHQPLDQPPLPAGESGGPAYGGGVGAAAQC